MESLNRIELHALSVAPDPADDTMARFERYERDGLISRHEMEVAVLTDQIARYEVRERRSGRRVNNLMLGLVFAALVACYFLVRDVGCRHP